MMMCFGAGFILLSLYVLMKVIDHDGVGVESKEEDKFIK